MKRITLAKIILSLGIFFAFSPIIATNLSYITDNGSEILNFCNDLILDKDNLKISAVSEKIYIVGNSGWAAFKAAGNCTGSGNYTHPYVIKDLVIDGGGSGSCILIKNSEVYFKIENCSLFNSSYPDAAIRLSHVSNGQLIDNNCYSNREAIDVHNSENINISGNTANNNDDYGIALDSSNYTTISGNTANYNNYGIALDSSNYTTISGNTANYNNYGIALDSSDYNTISGNTANNNNYGIALDSSDYNTIS
ncbi:MAG: nitrous oxide reductase family maturation protein NosD, partial [Candidatus Hodarchaeota archaeon]